MPNIRFSSNPSLTELIGDEAIPLTSVSGGTLSGGGSLPPGSDAKTSPAQLADFILAASGFVVVEELTSDKTLSSADAGKHFYVLSGTGADIDVTVPGGLGSGFNASFFHEGTGVFTIAGDVIPPAGGSLVLPTGGYASLIVFGNDALLKLVGLTESA